MEKTLQDWFATQYQRLSQSGETAKAHLLKESYFKVLAYSISLRTDCYNLTESGLIAICDNIYQSFCWQMRI